MRKQSVLTVNVRDSGTGDAILRRPPAFDGSVQEHRDPLFVLARVGLGGWPTFDVGRDF